MTRNDGFWTEHWTNLLKELWAAGVGTREIGSRLGCGKNAVIGKARRLGLDDHPVPHYGGRRSPARQPEPSWWGQLRDGGCSYDLGGEDGFRFCGSPVRAGSSFCVEHHELCWYPAPKAKVAA